MIVYGGEKMFAAGADIKEMADMAYADMAARAGRAVVRRSPRSPRSRSRPSPPITGYALGGGCELALAADRRIAGDNVKVGQPEILLGIIPGAGGTQRLARLIGPSKAKDLVYTGRFVEAEEALAIGLVDEVVAPDDVYSRPPRVGRAVRRTARRARCAAAKAAIDGGLDTDLANGLELESHAVRGAVRDRGPEDRHDGRSSRTGPARPPSSGAQ